VGLAQLIRFLVVELIHSDLVSVDSETFLVTDFLPTQSFKCTHKDRVHSYVHRVECSYVY
jgi:hypothetical protein